MSRRYTPRAYPKFNGYAAKAQYPSRKPSYSRQPSNYMLTKVANQAAAKGAALAVSKLSKKAATVAGVRLNEQHISKHGVHHAPHHNHASSHHEAKMDYPGAGQWIGEKLGSLVPIPGASSIGGWLGDVLHKGVKMITGFGTYHVAENTLVEGASPPEVYNKYEGKGTVIRHRDFIGDIVTASVAGETKIDTFIVQPGLSSTFPWLAAQASSYQQYGLLGTVFEFKSTSGDALNSTNTALGKVVMATQYDVTEPVFLNTFQAENSEYAMSFKPSQSCLHPIECAREESFNKLLFTRSTDVGDNEDPRLYDWCKMSVLTSGMQAPNVKIGELWITYEILFLKPQIAQPIGNTVLAYHGQITNGVQGAPFGGLQPLAGNTMNVYNVGGSASVIALPRESGLIVGQKFMYTYYSRKSGPAITMFPGTYTLGGLAQVSGFWDPLSTASRVQVPADGTSTGLYMTSMILEVTNLDSDPTIALNTSTLPAEAVDLVITQIPNQLFG
uniref:Putative capsid n=1 Tax=uncultured virus TaxID=340016 RepID=A0A1D8MJY4_9VIRU|nr:putative capsid [uncultured virus]